MHLRPHVVDPDAAVDQVPGDLGIALARPRVHVTFVGVERHTLREVLHRPPVGLVGIIVRHEAPVGLVVTFIDDVPVLDAVPIMVGQVLHVPLELPLHHLPVFRHPGRMAPGAHAVDDGVALHIDSLGLAERHDGVGRRPPVDIRAAGRKADLAFLRLQGLPIKGDGSRVEQLAERSLVLPVFLRRIQLAEQEDVAPEQEVVAQLFHAHDRTRPDVLQDQLRIRFAVLFDPLVDARLEAVVPLFIVSLAHHGTPLLGKRRQSQSGRRHNNQIPFHFQSEIQCLPNLRNKCRTVNTPLFFFYLSLQA